MPAATLTVIWSTYVQIYEACLSIFAKFGRYGRVHTCNANVFRTHFVSNAWCNEPSIQLIWLYSIDYPPKVPTNRPRDTDHYPGKVMDCSLPMDEGTSTPAVTPSLDR